MQAYIVNLLYVSLFSFSFLLLVTPQGPSSCLVTEVLDGDTIIVNHKNKIRLIGIDAPELKQLSFDHMRIGEMAKEWLERRVLNKRVQISMFGRGHYGRILGQIIIDDSDINKELVMSGMAVSFGKKYFYSEMIAQKKREGIWGTLGFYRPRVYRKKFTKRY